MAQIIVEEGYKHLPDDAFLRVKVDVSEIRTIPYTDKKTGEMKELQKIKWVFAVTDERPQFDEFYGRKVQGETWAKMSTSPSDTFRNWTQALLRRDLAIGFAFDLEDLVGLSAVASFKQEQDYKDKDKYWDVVDELMPLVEQLTPPF
jgi:hypothetical protein